MPETELPSKSGPWTVEEALPSGFYVVAADGVLVTWASERKSADRLVERAAKRDAEREREEVVRDPNMV